MRSRLRDMVAFLAAVQRPDGLMPQVGDADDGRLHILSGYGAWQPQDGRHLFGPASCFLGHREWASHGSEWMPWETVWWGFEVPGRSAAGTFRPGRPATLSPGRLTVMRRGRDYLLVTNGIVGTAGSATIQHNDLLGFEYHVDGVRCWSIRQLRLHVDPDARNLFRSTRSHSTLRIDGEEQNRLRPDWLFRMFEQANPEHLEVQELGHCMRYRGRHHGFARFPEPVVHERTLTLSRPDRVLTIADVLRGRGLHRIDWHFHFSPGVDVSIASNGSVTIRPGSAALTMSVPLGLRPTLSTGWYSPSYGVRRPCQCLDFAVEERCDGEREYRFQLEVAAS